MQKVIVAIGGGEIRTRGTASIDPTFEEKESEAALYPNREFGFRKILEACTGVFRQISEVPDGHPPAHQGAAFERADPEKNPVGRHHLRWRWKHAANDARLASSGRR
jgi:hypothetical protein